MNAADNDRLRQSIPSVSPPNLLLMTCGVAALPESDVAQILAKVRDFSEFSEGNDPYGEHDFGSFNQNGNKILWKIDDCAGEEGYNLVLTILLAEEY